MLAPQNRHVPFPIVRDQFAERKALLRVADGRREHLRHWQLPKLRVKLEPAIDRTRHADWQHPGGGNGGALELRQLSLHLLEAQTER